MHFRIDFAKAPDIDAFNKKLTHYTSIFKKITLDLFFDKYRIKSSCEFILEEKTFNCSFSVMELSDGIYIDTYPNNPILQELKIIKEIWGDDVAATTNVELYSASEYVNLVFSLIKVFCKLNKLSLYV